MSYAKKQAQSSDMYEGNRAIMTQDQDDRLSPLLLDP